MTVDFDAAIIGAGVIGLAIARELALAGKSVIVLESAARAGTETSARNSEVIHAGIYYPPGTAKARLCVKGRELLYAYCAEHGIPHQRLGKLIVACSAAEEEKLSAIKAQAEANGVRDLQWLSAAEAMRLEPQLSCTRALFSPSTGIVDAGAFMLSLQGVAESRGAAFAFNTSFTAARKQEGAFVIDAGGTALAATSLINCAGHGAHAAAAAMADYDSRHLPPKHFAAGYYCSVSGKAPFQHLVYPVPVSGALGIHATLDLAGVVRFGPSIQWIDKLDYALPDGLPELFSAAIASYWPAVRERELQPNSCGVRPKIHGPKMGFADFMIQTEADHGVPNLTNLFGIESPGLTAALAIAKEIAAGP